MFLTLFRKKFQVLAMMFTGIFGVFGLAGFHKEHDDHFSVMANLLESGGEPDRFFMLPIYFFGFFDSVGIGATNISIIWGSAITFWVFKWVESWRAFFISLFILAPAPMLYFTLPSKELFLVSAICLMLYFFEKNEYFKSFISIVIYSVLFRIYILVFSVAFLIRWLSLNIILLVFCFSVVVMLIYADYIYSVLEGVLNRRDVFYYLRSEDVRSTWSNPNIMRTGSDIAYNYLYAFFRLNIPVIFVFGIKEIFLQSYLIVSCFILILSYRLAPVFAWGMLFMVLIFPFIEPDLGAYLRHFSSWFPVLIYILNKRFFQGDRI